MCEASTFEEGEREEKKNKNREAMKERWEKRGEGLLMVGMSCHLGCLSGTAAPDWGDSRHQHLLETKSTAAAALFSACLLLKPVWVSNHSYFMSHSKRQAEPTVCLWYITYNFKRKSFFLAWAATAHFPHANECCEQKRKAVAIGELTERCGKCCVTGTETNTVPLCVPLTGKSPNVCVCDCGGVPFHRSSDVDEVL